MNKICSRCGQVQEDIGEKYCYKCIEKIKQWGIKLNNIQED